MRTRRTTVAGLGVLAFLLVGAAMAPRAHAVTYTQQVREVTVSTAPSGALIEREAGDFGVFSRSESLEESLLGVTLTASGFHASALQTDLLSFDLGASVQTSGETAPEDLLGLGSALFSVEFVVSEPTIVALDVNAGAQSSLSDTLSTATISLGQGSTSLFLLEVSVNGTDSRQSTLTLAPGSYRFIATINHSGQEGSTFAAGTMTFTPVPGPGAGAVLALAGVLAARRRR